jgi:hypothetical protein
MEPRRKDNTPLQKTFLGGPICFKGHKEERSLPSFLEGFQLLLEAMKAKIPPPSLLREFGSSWGKI